MQYSQHVSDHVSVSAALRFTVENSWQALEGPSKQAPRVVKIIGLWSVRMNRTFNGASCVEILKTNENNDLFNSVMWANGALCNLRPRVVRLAVQPLTAEMSEASLKRFLSRKWKEFMLAHSVDPGLCLDTCLLKWRSNLKYSDCEYLRLRENRCFRF